MEFGTVEFGSAVCDCGVCYVAAGCGMWLWGVVCRYRVWDVWDVVVG